MFENQLISTFTENQASRLTGLSVSQLRNWDSTGFFVPDLAYGDRRAAFSRLYSYHDLLSLKVLYKLRIEHEISLQKLRRVKEFLDKIDDKRWYHQKLYVLNKNVVYEQPTSGKREEVESGQKVFEIPLKVVAGSLENDLEILRARPDEKIGKIETARNVQSSQPTIAGTRVPVSSIVEFASSGYSIEEILREFPGLTAEDVAAALDYEKAS